MKQIACSLRAGSMCHPPWHVQCPAERMACAKLSVVGCTSVTDCIWSLLPKTWKLSRTLLSPPSLTSHHCHHWHPSLQQLATLLQLQNFSLEGFGSNGLAGRGRGSPPWPGPTRPTVLLVNTLVTESRSQLMAAPWAHQNSSHLPNRCSCVSSSNVH